MWVFLASESLLFAGLFALYAAYRGMYAADFDRGGAHNTLAYGTVNTYILLSSSLTVALSVWATRRERARLAVGLLLATIALGLAFLVLKTLEYAEHLARGRAARSILPLRGAARASARTASSRSTT